MSFDVMKCSNSNQSAVYQIYFTFPLKQHPRHFSIRQKGQNRPMCKHCFLTSYHFFRWVFDPHDPRPTVYHDDVIKWKHFQSYWPYVRGIHRSPVNSPYKGQWRGTVVCSLTCAWINGCRNSGEAGDLRRHGAHYDVTVMSTFVCMWNGWPVFHENNKASLWNNINS